MKCCRRCRPPVSASRRSRQSVAALRGEIDQVPSAVSAIKVDGQRAYKLAREGHVRRTRAAQGSHRPIRRAIRPARGGFRRRRRRGGLFQRAPTSARWPAMSAPRSVSAVTSPRCAEPASARSGSTRPHGLDDLAERPRLSYSLDEACLLTFPRRDLIGERGRGHPTWPCARARGHRRGVRGDRARRTGHSAAAGRRASAPEIRGRAASRHVVRTCGAY